MSDQLTGQQLRGLRRDPSEEPRLFYWQRSGGRAGEIDYLLQWGHSIVPIEVKAGAAGSMKSLHQFMHDKELRLAVRIDSNPPSIQDVRFKTTRSEPVDYRLVNLPHYLTWRLGALLDSGL